MSVSDSNLNSLSRYSKKSNRYILEAQDHCEVPAGCGGVVLRWRNPENGLPLTFRLYAGGSCGCFLDGQALSSARPVVAFGEHVISFVIVDLDSTQVVLLFAATCEDKSDGKGYDARSAAGVVQFLSGADGSWKYSCVEPQNDGWQRCGFDDSGWPTMRLQEWSQGQAGAEDRPQAYRAEELLRRGAQGLGVAEMTRRVWIRRAFFVRPPA